METVTDINQGIDIIDIIHFYPITLLDCIFVESKKFDQFWGIFMKDRGKAIMSTTFRVYLPSLLYKKHWVYI